MLKLFSDCSTFPTKTIIIVSDIYLYLVSSKYHFIKVQITFFVINSYPIRNLSKGQRCGSLEFIGSPTITIEGHPRLSNYFQSFPIQEVPLSRYWPFVGYANDFRHWITGIPGPNNWFPAVVIYVHSESSFADIGHSSADAGTIASHFWKKMNDNARSNPRSSFIF